MKEIHEKIIADLKWLAEKTEDPIVKITYGMSATIVDLHFGEFDKKAEIYNVQPKNDMQCGVGKNNI